MPEGVCKTAPATPGLLILTSVLDVRVLSDSLNYIVVKWSNNHNSIALH